MDAQTEQPLADVSVVARGGEGVRGTSTDVRGRYRIADLPAGDVRVEVSAIGYGAFGEERTVAPGDTTRLDVRLQPRTYRLGEITVGGAAVRQTDVSTTQAVPLADLAREDAVAVAEVARLIPAAHVQTNSRGETLVYLRGAGERQVALFFDGALLNVPWDNRVDLALVPASVVGGMTVAKGVPSVLYGTNVLGGAINLTSRTLEGSGDLTEVSGWAGAPTSANVHATRLGRRGRWSYTGAAGYATETGQALPGGADLPFSQPHPDVRTNTDRRLLSGFARVQYQTGTDVRLGVSLLHLGSEKGVAPESHLDPGVSRVRFWRYPLWRTTMIIGHGAAPLGRTSEVRGAVWGSLFAQRIRQFDAADYERVLEEQDDRDQTAGARLTWQGQTGPGTLRLAFNALTSRHEQQNTPFEEGRTSAEPVAPLVYRQQIYSGGAEYEVPVTSAFQALVGGSLDAARMPRTGDKPPRDPFTSGSVTGGLVYDLNAAWRLRAAVGRKVRFPTLRELFGEALGRFLVNPDLRPETALLADVGAEVRHGRLGGTVTLFLNRTSDTIDQRTVEAEGGSRRQRINLEGSRVVGVEAAGRLRLWPSWSLDGHLTWMRARAFQKEGGTRPLAERPGWLGLLALTRTSVRGVTLAVQTAYTGQAYSPDDSGAFAPLPAALVFGGRLGYRLGRPFAGEVFIRIDNATDALVLPQLGLPGAGREVRAGLSVSF